MRRFALTTAALLLSFSAFAGGDPTGYWKTIDDETDRPKSVVHITVDNGVAKGQIVQLYRTPDQDDDPFCTDCLTPEQQKQKINGMVILDGLEDNGKEWEGGTILDPGNGKTYSAFIEVQDGGKKLMVRGFIGFSLLGRTQHWYRVDSPDLAVRNYRYDPATKKVSPLVMADGTKVGE